MKTVKVFTSAASFTINCKKNSYTGYKWGHEGSTKTSISSTPFSAGGTAYINYYKNNPMFIKFLFNIRLFSI